VRLKLITHARVVGVLHYKRCADGNARDRGTLIARTRAGIGRKLTAVPSELQVVRCCREIKPKARGTLLLCLASAAYAVAGETSRAMRLALLISATRRS
jgi:hypothetical protein